MSTLKNNNKSFVLILSGPTGSGKSALSLEIAKRFSGEIVNADMGQFYEPFTIGTAKPTIQEQQIVSHHLFDIITEPKNLTVCDYRKLVLDKVKEVASRGSLPMLVGGSLFYLKSLFFTPLELDVEEKVDLDCQSTNLDISLSPWEQLKQIDPKRAEELHPNDLYRINRALDIWKSTKIKPSEFKPKFEPDFNFHFLFLRPDRDILKNRIEKRTIEMIYGSQSWIDESAKIVNTDWEDFLKIKKLIGYPEIIQWIKQGRREKELPELIERIQINTKQYAKRQLIFWKSFRRQLIENFENTSIQYMFSELKKYSSDEDVNLILKKIEAKLI